MRSEGDGTARDAGCLQHKKYLRTAREASAEGNFYNIRRLALEGNGRITARESEACALTDESLSVV
jgi:hypothetical protein